MENNIEHGFRIFKRGYEFNKSDVYIIERPKEELKTCNKKYSGNGNSGLSLKERNKNRKINKNGKYY